MPDDLNLSSKCPRIASRVGGLAEQNSQHATLHNFTLKNSSGSRAEVRMLEFEAGEFGE
jgi:hypothetical protein